MNLKPRRHEEPEINVVSLIDVVLLLVVFFMLSSRFTDEGLGDAEALAHAEGVGPHPLLCRIGDPDEVQQVLDPPRVNACQPRCDRERRPATPPGMHRRRVEQRPDHARRVGQLDERSPVDGRRTAIGSHQPDDHLQRGGFAGAVGPEKTGDGPGFAAQRDVADDRYLLVALGESGCRDHVASLNRPMRQRIRRTATVGGPRGRPAASDFAPFVGGDVDFRRCRTGARHKNLERSNRCRHRGTDSRH